MKRSDGNDAQEMARRAAEWFKSDEAKNSIMESDGRIKETVKVLEKGREIDPAKLHEPFTGRIRNSVGEAV